MIQRLRDLCLLIAASGLLAGCLGGITGNAAPAQVYDLVTDPRPVTVPEPRPLQLSIVEPRAGQMLDSARIAVRPTPGELRYYAGAAWRDPAPRLLQDAMLRAFEDAAAFTAVGRSGEGLSGDVRLTVELRRFEAVYADPDAVPDAVIELQAILLHGGSGRALASTRLQARRPAADVKVPSVVRALTAATDEVVAELVEWSWREAGAAQR